MITPVFFRVAAEWSVAEALELLDAVRVERVIVHRLEPDAESFYVYRRDDLIRQLRANDRGIVRDALALHDRRATPVIPGQLEVEEPAVVVAGGRIIGIALPTTRAISMSRPEVETWYLSTKAPQEIDVGARASLIIELTRDAGVYQELARALELAAGDEVKLVLHAAGAIAIDGRTEATLVVPSRSPETVAAGGATELFTLHGRSIGTGQVTVYAFRNGQSIASITLV
ncbi:MAG TPA: TCAD7 domain-containing protein, partial [Kofleriaceae bacterium]